MLSVGAKEQVLLKVQVAEMQRDAIRRLGVNLPGAVLNSGNITFTKVIQNAFPVTASTVPPAIAVAPGRAAARRSPARRAADRPGRRATTPSRRWCRRWSAPA